jgi:hypothetical protein
VKKKLIIIFASLLALVVLALVAIWYFMSEPLYQPGMVPLLRGNG